MSIISVSIIISTNYNQICKCEWWVPKLNKTVHTSFRMGPISVCVTTGRWMTLGGGGDGL